MSFRITESTVWVGKVDWELRRFHGEEYSTHRGTTYNSYLVRDAKTALIDTVWSPYAGEYVESLFRVVEPDAIDFVVVNHAEPDHSGALPELMRHLPDRPIYCSPNCAKSLQGIYHHDWEVRTVRTGDRLSLGGKELLFIEAPMLHWPDSMFCYLTGEGTLFSNDAFGQHMAAEDLFNDRVDPCELQAECIKYYANILTPFSPLVKKKIQEFAGLGLPLERICASHGVIWRDNPMQIVGKYLEWADNYQENQVTVIYDTMWNGTRRAAEALAQGIREAAPAVDVKLYNCARSDANDILTEVFKSKAVALGSPTVNKAVLSSVAALLEEIAGLRFKNKKAVSFGTYGWSGEGPARMAERLQEAGFELLDEGLKVLWNPDDEALEQCRALGRTVGPVRSLTL